MKVYRSIIFTKTPLKDTFALEGNFQILPFKSEYAPKMNKLVRSYPCFLEISVTEGQELIEREREIVDALTALTPYRFYIPDMHDAEWFHPFPFFVMDFEDLKEECNMASKTSSSFGYPEFYYPEMRKDLKCDGFTEVAVNDIMILPDHTYVPYTGSIDYTRPEFEQKNKIIFTKLNKEALSVLFSCKDSFKDRLVSISHLISSSMAQGSLKHSISFLVLVSAIESLMKLDFLIYGDDVVEKCTECGRPYSSIGKKFRTFLNIYAEPTSDEKKYINEIYGLRCKIAHSGNIFLGDYKFLIGNKQVREELHILDLTLAFARRSLINWLVINKEKLVKSNI